MLSTASFLAATLICAAPHRSSSDDSPKITVEAAAYLAEALAKMREVSFHREHVDWTAIRATAFAAAAGAEVPVDTYDALRGALSALGDHHSFLQLTEELARAEDERKRVRGVASAETAAPAHVEVSSFLTRRAPEAHEHATGSGMVARVVIPAFGGADVKGFAQRIQDMVRELDARAPSGWIVDLRGNAGGNMWPMLAGIGPVLGEGECGAFLELEGITGRWFYRAGASGVIGAKDGKSSVIVQVDRAHVIQGTPPVVVLIDKGTGSSGEAVAIAFKGRPRTWFVGVPTYGLSSSNAGFPMRDGANLVITTGLDVDRTGREYPAEVQPDEQVAFTAGDDPQIARAVEWLKAQTR